MRKNYNRRVLCMILITSLMIGSASFPSFTVKAETSEIAARVSEQESLQSVTDLKEYDTNEIIIQYKDGSSSTDVPIENETELTKDVSLIEVGSRTELKEAIEELDQDPNIEYIQPNYTYTIMGVSNDAYSDEQWAYNNIGSESIYGVQESAGVDINMAEAWGLFATKPEKEVVVAIVDTGIDYDHPDLLEHMWTNTGEIAGNSIDDDKNGFVDDVRGWNFYNNSNNICIDKPYYNYKYKAYETEEDHGTHVAGIIAATADNSIGVAGIASKVNVRIMPVKGLGGQEGYSNGEGTTSSITQAIQYADKMGADICNLSVGGVYYDAILESVIKDSDMLFVAASGNGTYDGNIGYDIDDDPVYPASYNLDNIISVANIRCDGNLDVSSNYGAQTVDIAAPGTDILSSIVDVTSTGKRNSRYAFFSGTSMAAPMVSGVAALLVAYHTDIDNSQVKKAIINSSQKLNSLTNKVVAGGMLDAFAALSYDINQPVIKTQVKSIKNSNYKTLVVTVTRPEGQIDKVAYAAGTKTIDSFEKGTKGTQIQLVNDTASVKITKNGTYTVYALDTDGKETIQTIKIKVLSVEKVKLSTTTKTIYKGKTYTIKTTLYPSKVLSKLTYKSSNPKIATVSSTGKITGKRKGTAQITVTSSNGKKAVCKVIIK